ncbi:MAG: GNAT family N-acetyltransferase [Gammaproteobacteria bacterium]|nr:GNAT family N-acetyltransferase [Gammaproteobacteria bacterium]
MSQLLIRPAQIDDAGLIVHFVTELAIYEKAEHEVQANEQHFIDTLFCEQPRAHALICELDGQAIGFAVYFYSYSTWLGKYGIYLEDLYVSPEYRGAGGGKALLRELARIAMAEDCGRIEWSVLDWNEPAIQFYKSLGALPKEGWTIYRMEGPSIGELADC